MVLKMMLLIVQLIGHFAGCQAQNFGMASSLSRTRFGKRGYEAKNLENNFQMAKFPQDFPHIAKHNFQPLGVNYNPSFRERFSGDQLHLAKRFFKDQVSSGALTKEVGSSDDNVETGRSNEDEERELSKYGEDDYLAKVYEKAYKMLKNSEEKDYEEQLESFQNHEKNKANVVPWSRFGRTTDQLLVSEDHQ